MNYSEKYAEQIKKADYASSLLNQKFVELAESMEEKGIKRGSIKWIYYNLKGMDKISKETNANFRYDFWDEADSFGFKKALTVLVIKGLIKSRLV